MASAFRAEQGSAAASATIDEAFYYAFPLYEFARTEQERTGAVDGKPGALNRLAHRAMLADHTSRQVTAPNNDTIYSSSFMDLAGGPLEVAAPSSADRYYSVAFMNAFTDNFAYIGTRGTKGRGGRYWIAGPEWTGTAAGRRHADPLVHQRQLDADAHAGRERRGPARGPRVPDAVDADHRRRGRRRHGRSR